MKGAITMHDNDDDPLPISSTYAARQRERDETYRREYARWIQTLPPEERQKLEAVGLDKAYLPSGSGGATKDAAESSRARCEDSINAGDEPAGATSTPPCPDHPHVADAEAGHDLLRRLIGEMLMQSNASLSLECLALVTGLAYDGDSMTEIAERHGVTRAAVSKRCVELTIALNLKPSRAMRPLSARHNSCASRVNHLENHP
jgi:DNA-directed RNA polymerase specialized sigma24 family protein